MNKKISFGINRSQSIVLGLTRNEVLNEVLGFLVAGYETTSSALAWLIHLLSKNPRVQKKIKEELSQTGANHQLTIEQLDFMVYLDCVVKEVLRFRPPTEGSVRTLTADDRLPESDFQLYKDDSVFIPYYNLAHDTRYWNIDPQIFYPERFEGDDKNHHPLANIPFGSGHRQCVGRDLAQLELKVIGARLMQLVTFGDGGDQVNSGGCIMGLTIMPKHVGVTINFD